MPIAGQIEFLRRKQRGHELELHTVTHFIRTQSVDPVHLDKRKILFTLFRGTDHSLYGIADFQSEQFDLRWGNIDIIR